MTNTVKSRLAGLLALLLVLGFLPSVATKPARAETLQISHPTIEVHGRIISSNSAPVAGALVTISAWPSSETLTGIDEGERVPMIYLTSVKTGSDGVFSATVELSTPDLVALRDRGELNFQAKSIDGTAVYLAEFTTSDKAPNLQRKKVLTKNIGNLTVAGRISQAKASRAVGGCGYTYYLSDAGTAYATVGSSYVAATSGTVSAQYKFFAGASTTLGIGIDSGAGFRAGGTNSVSSSINVTFPQNTTQSAKNHQISYMTAKYGIACSNTVELRAKYATGGARTVTAVLPTANFCVNLPPDTPIEISSSVASTNSVGFDTSGLISIDLSSRSGFTTSSSLTVENTSSISKRYCGVNNFPTMSPGKIVIKN